MLRVLRVLGLVVVAGCQQDLVLAMGDVTGVVDAAARGRAPAAEEVAFELPGEQPDIVVVPLEGDGPGVGGAAREAQATAIRNGRFDPISIPQGPLENTGVRFEGVSTRGSPSSMRGPGATNEFRQRRRD